MSQYIPTETNVKSNSCCVADEKHILEDWEEEDIFSQAMAQLDTLVETQGKIRHKLDQIQERQELERKNRLEELMYFKENRLSKGKELSNDEEDIIFRLSKGEEGLKNLLEMLECARRKNKKL